MTVMMHPSSRPGPLKPPKVTLALFCPGSEMPEEDSKPLGNGRATRPNKQQKDWVLIGPWKQNKENSKEGTISKEWRKFSRTKLILSFFFLFYNFYISFNKYALLSLEATVNIMFQNNIIIVPIFIFTHIDVCIWEWEGRANIFLKIFIWIVKWTSSLAALKMNQENGRATLCVGLQMKFINVILKERILPSWQPLKFQKPSNELLSTCLCPVAMYVKDRC